MMRFPLFERLRRRAKSVDDDGFTMVEVMVSLVIIAIVAAAGAAFFINSIRGVNGEKQRQEAAQIANQQIEQVQSVPVADLVEGRTQAMFTSYIAMTAATQLNLAGQDDLTNAGDYDSNTSDPLIIPFVPTTLPKVGGLTYTPYTYIDVCWQNSSTGVCGPTKSSSTVKEYRVSVDVQWTSTTPCQNGCFYTTSTLIDPTADPTFNTNISTPAFTSMVTSNGPTSTTVYNFNAADTCTTGAGTFAGDEVKMQATGLKSGATVKIVSAGGSINTSSINQPNANEIDFCLLSGDTPGSYTMSIINTDGGHFQTSMTEVPIISGASYNTSTGVETLTGGGFETGSVPSATGTPWTGYSVSHSGYPTSLDTLTLSSWTAPTNGATQTITLTNPDNTTASYSITAPAASTTGLAAVSGQTVTDTLSGSNFDTGTSASNAMSILTQTGNCNASLVYPITSTTSASLTLAATGGTYSNCTIQFVNSDGGRTSVLTIPTDYAPAVTTLSGAFVVGQTTSATIGGVGFATGMSISAISGGCSSATVTAITPSSPASSSNGLATLSLNGTGGTAGTPCVLSVKNADQGITTVTVPVDAAPTISGITVKQGTTTETTTLVHSTSYSWTVSGSGFVSAGSTYSLTENGTAITITPTITSGSITFTATTTSSKTTGVNTFPFVFTFTNADGGTTSKTLTFKVPT